MLLCYIDSEAGHRILTYAICKYSKNQCSTNYLMFRNISMANRIVDHTNLVVCSTRKLRINGDKSSAIWQYTAMDSGLPFGSSCNNQYSSEIILCFTVHQQIYCLFSTNMNTKVAVVLKSKITHVNKQQMRERKKPREDERWIDYFTVVELLNI